MYEIYCKITENQHDVRDAQLFSSHNGLTPSTLLYTACSPSRHPKSMHRRGARCAAMVLHRNAEKGGDADFRPIKYG